MEKYLDTLFDKWLMGRFPAFVKQIKIFFRKVRVYIMKLITRVRLWYLVRWIRKACVRDKCFYYILLNLKTFEIKVVNGNEYAQMKRYFKKKYKTGIHDYVYAQASPWGKTGE